MEADSWKSKLKDTFFEQVVQNMLKNKSVYGAVLCVENGNSSISWVGGAGNIKAEDRYFIASVTKLYVTAVMLMLRADNKLAFTDKIHKYFPEELIGGIHVLNGVDYSKEITIAHLLSNTSGIPDYFYYEKPKGEAASDLILGNDQPWPLEKAIQRAKTLKPKFKPGQKGKVHYSDTNYQLLGGIIGPLERERQTRPSGGQDCGGFSWHIQYGDGVSHIQEHQPSRPSVKPESQPGKWRSNRADLEPLGRSGCPSLAGVGQPLTASRIDHRTGADRLVETDSDRTRPFP
jgi:hypothetical protein